MSENLIIAGLGNQGKEYENTRHNFGFHAIDALEKYFLQHGTVTTLSGKKDPFILWKGQLLGAASHLLFIKPLTYMNRSGEPLQSVAAYYRIAPSQILVIHDEIDLPLGKMKLKIGGGNAGHNGLKSIQQSFGTPDFHRLRLGVGKPEQYDVVSYVLSRFTQAEQSAHDALLLGVVTGVLCFIKEGEKAAQRFCNSFSILEKE